MIWINFLHFYQPANTDFSNIREALDKSYWRLIRLLDEYPNLKFTLNISGCLLERLHEEGEEEFTRRLHVLLDKGQIELVGSAAYHAFLPLLPPEEVIRQIKDNERILREHFGKNIKLAGFFLPEMAYSSTLAKIVKDLNYDWIILDEIAYGGAKDEKPKFDRYYLDQSSGLKVVFRDRKLSSVYVPSGLISILKKDKKKTKASHQESVFITATDSELYGLRHEDPTAELEKIAKIPEIETKKISDFINQVAEDKVAPVKILASSWETSPQDIKKGQPYRLWLDKKNKLQLELWRLALACLKIGKKFNHDQNYYWYRWHLNRGLASCTFWWASANDFSYIFGPYAWNPDVIEKGLEDLVRSVRSIANPKSRRDKLKIEKYYVTIKELIWREHWQKHWPQLQ